jgi:hypothetical protein
MTQSDGTRSPQRWGLTKIATFPRMEGVKTINKN